MDFHHHTPTSPAEASSRSEGGLCFSPSFLEADLVRRAPCAGAGALWRRHFELVFLQKVRELYRVDDSLAIKRHQNPPDN